MSAGEARPGARSLVSWLARQETASNVVVPSIAEPVGGAGGRIRPSPRRARFEVSFYVCCSPPPHMARPLLSRRSVGRSVGRSVRRSADSLLKIISACSARPLLSRRSVGRSIGRSVRGSVCRFVRAFVRSFVRLFVCLSVCLFVCLSVYLSIYLSICLSVYLSIYLIYLSNLIKSNLI